MSTPAELRAAAGMTQAEWAKALGIDPATVRRYEAPEGLPSARAVPAPVLHLMQLLAGQHERWELVKKS
jgi:DNA-binding transcriptional regulator YiaG